MKKMKCKQTKQYSIYIFLVSLYILIQPFLDMYKTLFTNKIEFFGISIIELANLIIVSLICLITLILNKDKINKSNKKSIIILASISIIYSIYIILHVSNILNFNTSIFVDNNINAFVEIYYIFRALLEPLILIICIYINKFTKKAFYLIIKLLTLIVCGIIVVSNLFGFSLIAYSDENKLILDNLFSWFSFTDSYAKPLTSKGLFFSANQLSNLMIILLPINLYNFINKKSVLNIINLIIQMLSMLMLGTKTATIGLIGTIIGTIILITIISIKTKTNFNNFLKNNILFIVILISIFPFIKHCPLFLEYKNLSYEEKENIIINKEEVTNEEILPETIYPTGINFDKVECSEADNNKVIEFMEKNAQNFDVAPYYVVKYPIKNDPIFWCNIYKNYENYGNRELKTQIYSRILELNDNKFDKYLGLGYTLNMLNPETDYHMHYYQFGIIGLFLFIGPYILLFFIAAYHFFKHFLKNFKYENILILTSCFFGIVSPHISGHLFGNLFVSLPLSIIIIMAYLVNKGEIE